MWVWRAVSVTQQRAWSPSLALSCRKSLTSAGLSQAWERSQVGEGSVAGPCQGCRGLAVGTAWWPRVLVHLISLGFPCAQRQQEASPQGQLSYGACRTQAQHTEVRGQASWTRLSWELCPAACTGNMDGLGHQPDSTQAGVPGPGLVSSRCSAWASAPAAVSRGRGC